MAVVFLESAFQDGLNGTPWTSVGALVEVQRPISYPRQGLSSLSKLCLISHASPSSGALAPARALSENVSDS